LLPEPTGIPKGPEREFGFLALNREPVSSLKVAAYRSILPSRRMLFGGCLGLASRQTKVLSGLEHSTQPGKLN
jgi:hypothetical protein